MSGWQLNFLLGVASSLLASLVIIGIAGILSKTVRWVLTGLLGRMLDIDIEIVFASPREAAAEVKREIARSAQIFLMTGRGSELQRETFEHLFSSISSSQACSLYVLLPDIDPTDSQIDWVARREQETALFDPAAGKGLLRQQIITTSMFLDGFDGRSNLRVRYYNLPLMGRILITDRCAFLTPYSKLEHSRKSKVIKYRRGGDMYDFLKRIFDEAWATSRAASGKEG